MALLLLLFLLLLLLLLVVVVVVVVVVVEVVVVVVVVVVVSLFFLCPPGRSLQAKNYKLGFVWNGTLPGTKNYSAENVFLNASSFPLCSDIDSLWKRNCVSNGSSVIIIIFFNLFFSRQQGL